MPATSKRQRRLMGMAYAVKRGRIRLSDIPAGVRDVVRRLARSMSLSDLREFAKTPEKSLPEVRRTAYAKLLRRGK